MNSLFLTEREHFMNPFEAFDRPDEQPLDVLVSDGGFSCIFRRICCIGDSLSSGEFEIVNSQGITEYLDVYEHSWGQYLARMTGAKVWNFSRGGMTAQEYCDSFADSMGFWDVKYNAQVYLIALGANDLFYAQQTTPLGSVSDIDPADWRKNRSTFAGYFGQIVQRLQAQNPNAKFFFLTMPKQDTDSAEWAQRRADHADLLHRMAALFPNSYVVDLHRYAPVYDRRFRDLYYLRGHMNPCGYLLTARIVASYLDYLIRHHMEDFKCIGLV